MKLAAFVLGLSVILTGCIQTFHSLVKDGAAKAGLNRDEQEVVAAVANRETLMKKSKNGYEINKSKVTKEEVVGALDEALADLEEVQSVKSEDWEKYNSAHDLWGHYRKEERIFRFLRDSVRAAHLYEQFGKLMGENGGGEKSAYAPPLFIKDASMPFSPRFISSRIEEAKRTNKLRLTQTFIVFLNDKYGLKTVDPADPSDSNRFLLKEDVRGLEFNTYAVMEETDADKVKKIANEYVEATRVVIKYDGNSAPLISREPYPALKIFSAPERRLNIVVGDTDKAAEIGFGTPDFLETMADAKDGYDFYLRHREIVNRLFAVPPPKGPKPKKGSQRVEIARVSGETTSGDARWEKSPSSAGWTVSLKYADKNNANYNVKIAFRESDGQKKRIKHIIKEWHAHQSRFQPSSGAVLEYYAPKSPYDQKDVLEAKVLYREDTKKITVTRAGEQSVIGFVYGSNIFAKDKPEMIDFDYGSKRYRIADRDGDGIYESRREIAKPVEHKTGIYDESPADYDQPSVPD